jgi:hypothetical protein
MTAFEEVFVVQGRHGELHVTESLWRAQKLWAQTNGYHDWFEFWKDYKEEIERSNDHFFLDEGGRVDRVRVT